MKIVAGSDEWIAVMGFHVDTTRCRGMTPLDDETAEIVRRWLKIYDDEKAGRTPISWNQITMPPPAAAEIIAAIALHTKCHQS